MKWSPRTCTLPVLLALLAAFAVPALAATEITPQERKLIPLAKKEGSVTFLETSFKDETMRRLGPAFVKHYDLGSGFKVNHVLKGTGPTVSMARQEIKAGKFSFDIVSVASAGFFAGAARQGAFLPLDSGHWKKHEENWKKAGIYHQYPLFVSPYSYTFQPVWNVACPGMAGVNIASYDDILNNPALKGKVLASDVTKSESYSLTTLGLMENGYDVKGMWKKLKALDPLVAFRTEEKMQRIVNCEQPVDMWNLSGRALQKIREKPDLEKGLRWGTYKEGMVLFGQQAGVIKGAKNPNAAKLWLDFLLTKEAADIVAEMEVSYYTMLKDYEPPDSVKKYMIDFKKVKFLPIKDQVGAAKAFKKMHEEWQQVFR